MPGALPDIMAKDGPAVWVLPNPSGLDRAFTLDQLVSTYAQLYLASPLSQL